MPGFLVHEGASVSCAHQGQAQPILKSTRVFVDGKAIVLAAQPAAYSISACPYNVSSSPVPCLTAQMTTTATKITSDTLPVLLEDSQATCIPNGTPLTISPPSVQKRVKGI